MRADSVLQGYFDAVQGFCNRSGQISSNLHWCLACSSTTVIPIQDLRADNDDLILTVSKIL
jgi:hypothetical protein